MNGSPRTCLAAALLAGCGSSGTTPGATADAASDAPVLFEASPSDGPVVDGGGSESGLGCSSASGNVSIVGTLHGAPISQSYASNSDGVSGGASSSSVVAYSAVGTDGIIIVEGNGGTGATDPVQAGILIMPAEGPDPGAVYCMGSGSNVLVTTGGGIALSARPASRAGACPSTGTAQGTWTGCVADAFWSPEDGGPYEGASCTTGKAHLVGQLDGTAFDRLLDLGTGPQDTSGPVQGARPSMTTMGDLGLLILQGVGDGGAGLVTGSVQLPPQVSTGRALFCISPSSTASGTAHVLRFTLRGVTSAGSCATASGGSSVDICAP